MSSSRVVRAVARCAVVVAITTGALGGVLPLSGAHAASRPRVAPLTTVLVLAVPGLQWSDVTPNGTPHLWALAQRSARGVLAVKSAGRVATCAAAMTTLGAGNRATATPGLERSCLQPARSVDRTQWPALVRANRHQLYGTQVGALALALDAHGFASYASGSAGAWLAAALPDGNLVKGLAAPTVDVELVDVAHLDGVVAARASVVNDNALILVVGAGDGPRAHAGLRVAMAAGAGFTPGRLTSDTTGRSPYVELIDVAPTILAAMGVAVPSTMAGQRWRMSTRGTTLARDRHDFVDMSRHAQVRSRWGGWFAAVLIGFGVAACVLGSLFLLCGVRRRAAVEALCYFTSALPVSTYMLQVLPWWRWNFVVSSTCVGLLAVVLAVAALVAARRWPPWGGLAFVVTSTALVLGVDLLTGSHLQLDGLLGDSTTVAGRFRGAGNTAFAVFAAAALLTAGVVASALRKHGRRVAVAGAVVVGLFALVLDGAPSLGDDLGGVLAIAPALAVLTLLLLGVRLGVRVWLVAGALAVLAGGALIAYDAIAGGGHIGRFAGQAGSNGARVTIDRKLAANLGSWHRSDYLAVVGFGVAAVIVTWRRTYRALAASSGVRAAFVAVAVCGVVGGALNDSGVVVPGAVALVAVPLLLAGSLRAQQ